MSSARAWGSAAGGFAGERLGLPAADPHSDIWAGGKAPALGLAIVVVILGGMAIGSGLVTMGGVAAAFAVSVVFPQVGLIVLAGIGTLKPPGVIPAPGFEVALVAVSIVGCLFRLPVNRRPLTVSAPLLALTGFVAFAFLSQLPSFLSAYSSTKAHDIGFLFYQLATSFGTIVLAGFVLRGRSPYPVLVALLASALIAALLAFATADGGGGLLANLAAAGEDGSRATGPFGNPNNFGQCMAYGGLLALGWGLTVRRGAARWMLLGVAAVLITAIVVSLSRGALVALLVGLIALAFGRSRATGVAAAIAVLALAGIGYPLFLQLRLSVDFTSSSAAALAGLASSDAGRLGAVLAGPGLFASSPIFGVGFGQYKYLNEFGLVAHNWYGTVLAELGTVGTVLWLLVLLGVARWLPRRPQPARQMGTMMFVAALAGCLFLEPPTSVQTAVIPSLVIVAALIADWSHAPVGHGPVLRPVVPVPTRDLRPRAVPAPALRPADPDRAHRRA